MISSIALAFVLAAAADPLSINVSVARTTILVGGPIKVAITWTATESVVIETNAVEILIDGGSGFAPFRETTIGTSGVVSLGATLPAGITLRTADVLSASGQVNPDGSKAFRFPFPQAGRYKLKARYAQVDSNEITIDVAAPQGEDAAVFRVLQSNPHYLTPWAVLEDIDQSWARSLLDQNPASPYLYRPQLLLWGKEIQQAVWAFGSSGQTGSPLSAHLGEVLQRVAAVDWSGGAFDEDRLLLVATTRLKWGDRPGARALCEELVAKYPNGAAAEEAGRTLREIGDTPDRGGF